MTHSLAVDYRLHIANGISTMAHTPFSSPTFHSGEIGVAYNLFFLGRLRLSLFSWLGGSFPRSACRLSWRSCAVLRGWCFSPFPVLACFFAHFRAVLLSVSVCPSARLSSVFAPFPCVFWAVSCLALRCPFRSFDFNALFRPFSARFCSARAIYQGNKKSPF